MKYLVTRERSQTVTVEVEAESPEQAVIEASKLPLSAWDDGGEGFGYALIDAVSEGWEGLTSGEGRCWGVEHNWLAGTFALHEVDDG